MKKYFLVVTGLFMFMTSCNKNDDNDPPIVQEVDLDTQDFMWKAMNLWYFWQADVADLSDTRFSTNSDYTEFLKNNSDPSAFFENKLLFNEDRFSYHVENYKDLVQSFSGVSKSNGLEFSLVRFSGSDGIFGYVEYIIPDSDAAGKEIARGDIFTGVNGTDLDINNYRDLLFGDNDTYTLNMADIANNTISDNGKEVSLTKEAGLVENPVFISKIIDKGVDKIGYLMYNRFTSNFDDDLNDAFGGFVAGGVTDLILDLRYNPGGSVNSSRLLASMIYGTKTNELYIRQRWNAKIQSSFNASDLEDYFASKTGSDAPINTLNLNKVYVIATGSSASASELVMNGLEPYVDVIHIGETTTGKNEFSLTMVDDPKRPGGPFIYTESREGNINPKNKYGLQPLVGRNENADGFSDYTSGLVPDIEIKEDLEDFGVLGNEDERLLARAIEEITGTSSKRDFTPKMPFERITTSRVHTPLRDDMYIDKPLKLNIDIIN